MSDSTPEQNIEGDQVVVNNAPDGGGNDGDVQNDAPAGGESTEGGDTSGDEAQQDTGALQE